MLWLLLENVIGNGERNMTKEDELREFRRIQHLWKFGKKKRLEPGTPEHEEAVHQIKSRQNRRNIDIQITDDISHTGLSEEEYRILENSIDPKLNEDDKNGNE